MVLEADLRKRKEIKVEDIVKDKSIKICGFLKIKSGRKGSKELRFLAEIGAQGDAVSYTHLTLPTRSIKCRSRWSPYH